MKFRYILIIIFIFISVHSSGKIGLAAGFDISPNSLRIGIRNWFNKTDGFEIGFGPTAKFEDFKFDDVSIQGKYFIGLHYDRFLRTYTGVIARFTIINDPRFNKNLPSGGVFAGSEWYLGKYKNQGIAIEGGLMYGRISRKQYISGPNVSIEDYYKEFPVYLTFSYKYYFK